MIVFADRVYINSRCIKPHPIQYLLRANFWSSGFFIHVLGYSFSQQKLHESVRQRPTNEGTHKFKKQNLAQNQDADWSSGSKSQPLPVREVITSYPSNSKAFFKELSQPLPVREVISI